MENVSFYSPPMLDFIAALKSTLCLIWKNIPIKRPWLHFPFKYRCWLLTALNFVGVLFSSRWKYGSRISAPNTKKSWNMAADQKSISTAPAAPSPPAHLGCPNFGKSQWPTKEATCIQTVTWTVSATGIQTTLLTRTPCPGLRWCECFTFDFMLPDARTYTDKLSSPPPTHLPSKCFSKLLCLNFNATASHPWLAVTSPQRTTASHWEVDFNSDFLPGFILCMIEFYCKTNFRLNRSDISK